MALGGGGLERPVETTGNTPLLLLCAWSVKKHLQYSTQARSARVDVGCQMKTTLIVMTVSDDSIMKLWAPHQWDFEGRALDIHA